MISLLKYLLLNPCRSAASSLPSCNNKGLSALRPPLKALMPARRRLAAAARTALLVAASPASRHPPRLCAVMQKQNPARQCCHRAPPCVACGFFATRTGRPRGGAVDKLRPRRGVRCEKHNTKTANVSG